MSRVLTLLAQGFEEIEAVTVIDLLRRADITVFLAGIHGREISGSHDISILCDGDLTEVNPVQFDCLFLPGGQPGTNNLRSNEQVLHIVRSFDNLNKIIAAICAAPTVLQTAGILNGRKVTSYPADKNFFNSSDYLEQNVVTDGNLITSRGVGTAIEFALQLIEVLSNRTKARDLAGRILHRR